MAAFACAACQHTPTETSAVHPPSASPTASHGHQMNDFSEALRIVESALGTKAAPLTLDNGEVVSGGWMFKTENGLGQIGELNDQLLSHGAYLFLVQPGFDKPDTLGLVPTGEKYEVIRMVGTNGNAAHTHEEVVAWLKDLDRREPWLLVGASYDFVEGFFAAPVRDPHALAQSVLSFCPDFYYQGIGLDPAKHGTPLEETEKYFQTERLFHFWWD